MSTSRAQSGLSGYVRNVRKRQVCQASSGMSGFGIDDLPTCRENPDNPDCALAGRDELLSLFFSMFFCLRAQSGLSGSAESMGWQP